MGGKKKDAKMSHNRKGADQTKVKTVLKVYYVKTPKGGLGLRKKFVREEV